MQRSMSEYIVANKRSRSWILKSFTTCRYSLMSKRAVMAPARIDYLKKKHKCNVNVYYLFFSHIIFTDST